MKLIKLRRRGEKKKVIATATGLFFIEYKIIDETYGKVGLTCFNEQIIMMMMMMIIPLNILNTRFKLK